MYKIKILKILLIKSIILFEKVGKPHPDSAFGLDAAFSAAPPAVSLLLLSIIPQFPKIANATINKLLKLALLQKLRVCKPHP